MIVEYILTENVHFLIHKDHSISIKVAAAVVTVVIGKVTSKDL